MRFGFIADSFVVWFEIIIIMSLLSLSRIASHTMRSKQAQRWTTFYNNTWMKTEKSREYFAAVAATQSHCMEKFFLKKKRKRSCIYETNRDWLFAGVFTQREMWCLSIQSLNHLMQCVNTLKFKQLLFMIIAL